MASQRGHIQPRRGAGCWFTLSDKGLCRSRAHRSQGSVVTVSGETQPGRCHLGRPGLEAVVSAPLPPPILVRDLGQLLSPLCASKARLEKAAADFQMMNTSPVLREPGFS